MIMKPALFTLMICTFIGLLLVSEPFWRGRYADGCDLCFSFSCSHWFRGSIV